MLDPKIWALSDIFTSGNSGSDCGCSLMLDPRLPTHGKTQESRYLGGQNAASGKGMYKNLLERQKTINAFFCGGNNIYPRVAAAH
ncbi:hypothetical protein llap_7867 [Limosa lapponica baueri]|uniref:Uncharacterized protein n=1 Tax=Limosa lapponica baueri TaxID=1758121 RepID=A0A2I0U6Z7_LIMLA|nr:hypothetical protein llap_7867 [Limosa lapponica baueri]